MKILLKHANIYGGDTADILVEDGKITGIGSFDSADEIHDMSGYAAVLPGVIQLGTAHRLAEAFIGHARTLRQVKKMKFSHVLQPGEAVRFTLTKMSDDEFTYDFRKGDVPCASGVLCF